MRVRLLSRTSALAVLQAQLVTRALRRAQSSIEVVPATRSSEGDRDRRAALWAMADKGLFTTDLSHALVADEADVVVHSWKDLPIESYPGTVVAGTIARADPRDVLLVRQAVVDAQPAALTILSSSPRRVWQMETTLPALLPWRVSAIHAAAVRGNIPTRLEKLLAGDGDALVVAKAALDRLLSSDAPASTTAAIRTAIDRCRWMVLPVREFPTAPAQGALAIEVAASRRDLVDAVRAITHEPTWRAVRREREILAALGGGCHEAMGATVLVRDYGSVTSVRARVDGRADVDIAASGSTDERHGAAVASRSAESLALTESTGATGAVERRTWSLERVAGDEPPKPAPGAFWPRPDERGEARRRPLDPLPPIEAGDLWIARADALPATWNPSPSQLVWVAGSRTWQRLAARGVWVHGSAEGLGDAEDPNVAALAARQPAWRRLTHADSGDPDAVATYVVERTLPADLAARTHFFWTSGSAFREALQHFPSIAGGWHASGPGRTARVIHDALGPNGHASVWLDYDQWRHEMTS